MISGRYLTLIFYIYEKVLKKVSKFVKLNQISSRIPDIKKVGYLANRICVTTLVLFFTVPLEYPTDDYKSHYPLPPFSG